MNAASRSSVRSTPLGAPDPALQVGLAELLQLGLVIARVSARLAEVEGLAVEVLAEAAVGATRAVLTTQGSLADAAQVGRDADISDAARDAIAARMASITETFDKAARAVRRTAALQARLAEGRSVRERPPGSGEAARPARGVVGARAANDAERTDRMDDPEWGDEIRGRSDEEVVRDIRRDLAPETHPDIGFGPDLLDEAGAVCSRSVRPGPAGPRPMIAIALPEAARPAAVLPEPDTG